MTETSAFVASCEALPALTEKYRRIAALRSADERAPPETLRALASEFPGALRELDSLPLPVIEARIVGLARALSTTTIEPWMEWMLAYHALMRAALALKRQFASELGFDLDLERATQIAQGLKLGLSASAGAAFVREVARPPGGRLNRVIFQLLECAFGVSATQIESTLFFRATPTEPGAGSARREGSARPSPDPLSGCRSDQQ